MSRNPQSRTIQTLPGDREALYNLVWRESAERIASLCNISIEGIARRCAELQIPRPLSGYWKALEKGTAPAIPPLPALKQGRGVKDGQKDTPSVRPPATVFAKKVSGATKQLVLGSGNVYGLIHDLTTYLPVSTVTRDGYYKPAKKKLLDVHVSATGFESAIKFLRQFFDALAKHGYRVRLADRSEDFHRAEIDIREDPQEAGIHWVNLWRPFSASIICTGDMHFAFTLAEMTEYVPAKLVKDRYVRDEKMVRWSRGKNANLFLNASKHTLPSGRFLLQLYSPYPDAQWERQFRQTKQFGLISQISAMILTMQEAVPLISKQLEEARINAEKWRIQRQQERVISLEKERIRREEEAYSASRTELKSIMAQWTEDKRLEQFFREAEQDAASLDEQQKSLVMERLQLARQFVSGDTAVQRLLKWKTPQELLGKK
ncbi:hypothetical protein E0L21_23915 [Kosakonia quasisacchari]|uniref:Uncharacterized protein n=1 Tax=Kosakonia quasisacchari TaxID=2529380 RepID=A0A4R0GLQ9_9ENTR|nr:hypothetical protein [Kosakonia quasisacchari]TCB96401.1 hypothetical protein E0L21_23915 [Kosakonia quasisacchari]